jgi:hypothetical protein
MRTNEISGKTASVATTLANMDNNKGNHPFTNFVGNKLIHKENDDRASRDHLGWLDLKNSL